ncbi:MAG: hypothetical protein QHH15_07495, partial [Candidatus Thermoplasmatota archaeon]|nr:hypothetical protein [Candidatus Thermoplasmatota archaeon]
MKERKNNLKAAIVLLITALMIFSAGFSAAAVKVETDKANIETGEVNTLQDTELNPAFISTDASIQVQDNSPPMPARMIVWDNGPFDEGYAIGNGKGENTYFGAVWLEAADDFELTATTEISGGHFEGLAFFSGLQVTNIMVRFFEDAGGVPAETPFFSEDSYNFVESDYYDPYWGYYHVDIDVSFTPVTINPGHYWVQFTPYGLSGNWFYQGCTTWDQLNSVCVRDGDPTGYYQGGFNHYNWLCDYPGYDINFKLYAAGAHMDVQKYIYVPVSGYPADWTLTLMDTWGDGWNGGYLDVYQNEVGIAYGLTVDSGYGPVYFTFTVNSGDVIFVDYTYGSWPSENHWWLTDHLGNTLFDLYGGYDYNAYDRTVNAPAGTLVDADTPEEAVDFQISSIVQFQIIVTNDGDYPINWIWVYDVWEDSIELVGYDIPPSVIGPGYAYWYYDWTFLPGEFIIINLWFHVVGPHCSVDYNWGAADGFDPDYN